MSGKPLNGKNYGSISHLPNSRLGPGEHCITGGQVKILTIKARDKHDRIIVQEKLDGSNVGVLKLDDKLIPLTRAGYVANTSPYKQHHMFFDWVFEYEDVFMGALLNGERICGEWLALAHGTRYCLVGREPFAAFDIIKQDGTRLPYDEFVERTQYWIHSPKLISDGPPIKVEEALKILGEYGHYGAIDPAEGLVYRVERFHPKQNITKVDFLAKYVRPGKVDGCYLPFISGKEEIYNWAPGNKQNDT